MSDQMSVTMSSPTLDRSSTLTLSAVGMRKSRSQFSLAVRRLMANPMAVLGLVIVVLVLSIAAVGPYVAPEDPIEMNLSNRFIPPGREHLLGTDDFGRDILSRLLFGARQSLMIGIVSIGIGLVVGVVIGLVSGYAGGWVDMIIQRLNEIMLAFPDLLLALAIIAVLGPSLRNVVIAIGIGGIPGYVRLMRGQVLVQREREFVDAARISGAGAPRIIFRHILPNSISPLIVLSSMGIAGAILAGSALSFIGMGAQPPSPEWGAMLSQGRSFLRHEWWIATFPGIVLAITALGFNLLGDGLRDAFDPQS